MQGTDNGPADENERYFVRRSSGKVFGPFDKNAIRMMLKAEKIEADAEVSADKDTWRPLSAIPAFADLIDEEEESFSAPGREVVDEEADPAPSDLPRPKGNEQDAEASAATGSDAQLPRSKDPSQTRHGFAHSDLPASKSEADEEAEAENGADLPTPKADDPSSEPASEQGIVLGSIDDLPAAESGESADDGDAGGGIPLSGGPPDEEAADETGGADDGDAGAFDLPTPKALDEDDADELPASADQSDAHDDLPASAQSDLPRAKSESRRDSGDADADLPASAQSELPRAKSDSGGGLPQSAQSQSALPRTKQNAEASEDDLPRSAESNLPRAERDDGDDLPRSAADNLPEAEREDGDDLPRSAADNLPEAERDDGDDLPRSAADNLPSSEGPRGEADAGEGGSQPADDDLFAEEEDDDLFDEQKADDDLFGEAEEDDLFAEQEEDDDLFGGGDDGGGADDLFGGGDDARQTDGADGEADDLFGGEEDDDLFGPAADQETDEKDAKDEEDEDFLSGGDQFDFLDEDGATPDAESGFDHAMDSGLDNEGSAEAQPSAEADGPADSPTAPPAAEEGWSDEIEFDDEEDEDLELDSGPVNETAGADIDADDPFRPASRGVPEESEEDEGSDRERSGSRTVLTALLGLTVLAAGGWYAYQNYFKTDPKPQKTHSTTAPDVVSIDASVAREDIYGPMRSAVRKAMGGKLEGADRPALLLVESLLLSRYDDAEIAASAKKLAAEFGGSSGGMKALAAGAYHAQAGRAAEAEKRLKAIADKDGQNGYFANLLLGIAHLRGLEDPAAAPDGESDAEKDSGDAKNSGSQDNAASEDEKTATSDEPSGEADREKKDAKDGKTPSADGSDTSDGEATGTTSPDETGDGEATADADRTRQVKRARSALQKAAELAPKLAAPHYWLGRLARLEEDAEAARTHFDDAIERQSNHVASRLSIAELDYDQGALESTRAQTEKILSELGAAAAPSETAYAYHLTARVHTARSETDKAIEAFTKALQKDADRPETLRLLAQAYERAGKYQQALNFFRSNKALEKKNPEVILGIVRSHMGMEQWPKAVKQLERGAKLFPEDARFPYYLGKLNLKRGKFREARRSMREAVTLDPSLLEGYGMLAQLNWQLDRDGRRAEHYVKKIVERPEGIDAAVAEKVAEYYRMRGKRDLAKQWYRSALDHNPNSWPAKLALAKLHLEDEETEAALELLKRAEKSGVQDIRLSAYLADAYRQAEKYDRAIQAINEVIDKRPDNPDYVFIRGLIHFDRGNYQTAKRDFARARELDTRFHEASFYVGRCAYEQGQYKEAMRIFQGVLDYQPDNGAYRYWMGRAFEAQGRDKEALNQYREATKRDETYGLENPSLYVRRGRLLIDEERYGEGRRDIARALKIDPKMTSALLAMGEAHFASNDYEGAIEFLKRALDQDPKLAVAQYKVGMAYVYTDRERQGAEHLQEAVRHGYEDTEVYQTLGYLYKGLGKRRLAVKAFKSYLRETPDAEMAAATRREMLQQIQALQR